MNYKYCVKCGNKLNENSTFCSNCGNEIISDVISRDNINVKKCKYCQSVIPIEASVCPKCKRNLNPMNNPLWLIPILIIVIVGLYFFLSPNAPLKVREVLCTWGIRSDKRYCSYFIWEK